MKTLGSPLMHTNLRTPSTPTPFLFPIKSKPHLTNYPRNASSSTVSVTVTMESRENLWPRRTLIKQHPTKMKPLKDSELLVSKSQNEVSKVGSNLVLMGAITVGVAVFVMGVDDDHQRALALGPEGPLVEEFWDNMRRYALYALTVSTGFAYTVFQPILELLRNPISAILVIAIFGGSVYIVTQVLSAMVGVSDFSYDYGY